MVQALPRERLKIYLLACDLTVAAALVKEAEGKNTPIDYVSHSLKDAEKRYS